MTAIYLMCYLVFGVFFTRWMFASSDALHRELDEAERIGAFGVMTLLWPGLLAIGLFVWLVRPIYRWCTK